MKPALFASDLAEQGIRVVIRGMAGELLENHEGGEPDTVRKSPGVTTFDPIFLGRGVTHDTEFERWAN